MSVLCALWLGLAAAGRTSVAALPATGDEATERMVPMDILNEEILTAVQSLPAYAAIGPADLRLMLDLEKQKDLVGCDDATCVSEIAGALGVDFVIGVRIGRIATEWAVAVKLMRVRGDVGVVTRRVEYIPGRAAELLKGVGAVVRHLFEPPTDPGPAEATPAPQPLTAALAAGEPLAPVARPPETPLPPPESGPVATAPTLAPTSPPTVSAWAGWRISRWLTGGLGLGAAAGFVVMLALNGSAKSSFATSTGEQAMSYQRTADATALAGNVLLVTGIVAGTFWGVTWFFDS